MRETLAFGWEILISPSKALRRLQDPDAALKQSLILYIVFLLASIAFNLWKPENFPPSSGDLAIPLLIPEPHGLLFWINVQIWDSLLSGIWIVFLAWFAAFFSLGFASLPILLFTGGLLGLAPGLLLLLHHTGKLPNNVIFIFWISALAFIFPLLKKRSSWKPLASMILAINAVCLALFIPAALSVIFNSATAYTWIDALGGLWMLGLGSYFLARLENISTARAFSAIFLSFFWQTSFCASLYLLNILSKETFKAMLVSF